MLGKIPWSSRADPEARRKPECVDPENKVSQEEEEGNRASAAGALLGLDTRWATAEVGFSFFYLSVQSLVPEIYAHTHTKKKIQKAQSK